MIPVIDTTSSGGVVPLLNRSSTAMGWRQFRLSHSNTDTSAPHAMSMKLNRKEMETAPCGLIIHEQSLKGLYISRGGLSENSPWSDIVRTQWEDLRCHETFLLDKLCILYHELRRTLSVRTLRPNRKNTRSMTGCRFLA
eukprot:26265-Rhodomonas_salina.1